MTVRHLGVTLDCVDLERCGAFWSAVLDLPNIEREGDYLLLRAEAPRSGFGGFTLQQVPDVKTTKNRMHFDVVVDDVEPEVQRVIGLGGVVVAREVEPTVYENVVMADPEGNEFCIIRFQES